MFQKSEFLVSKVVVKWSKLSKNLTLTPSIGHTITPTTFFESVFSDFLS